MQLNKKKELAARTLGIGKSRVILNTQRLDEIKEAITKQDIRDLVQSKAIAIKEITGRRKKVKRKTRRRRGSIRLSPNSKKREYMIITRKLRKLVSGLKVKKIIRPEEYVLLRKEIRARQFDSGAKFKERINQMIKERTQ